MESENNLSIYPYQISNLIRNSVRNISNVHDFLGQPSYFHTPALLSSSSVDKNFNLGHDL